MSFLLWQHLPPTTTIVEGSSQQSLTPRYQCSCWERGVTIPSLWWLPWNNGSKCMTFIHILPPMWSQNTTMLGELVLLWAMLQPTLQAAWHHTYTWHEKLDQFPAPESTLSNRLFHANSNSNTLWSSQSQHIHQQLLLHVVATTHCSGQTPRAISARPILLSPGKLSNLQACRLADASTPAQRQHLMENSQQDNQQVATLVLSCMLPILLTLIRQENLPSNG